MKPEAVTYAGLAFALTVLVACAGAPEGTQSAASDPLNMTTPAPLRASPALPAAATAAPARMPGFLTAATAPDALATIPPAPKAGEPRNDLDWAIFKATRKLEGTERWALAQNDDNYRPAALLKDYSCAVGAELTPENAPTLARILARTTADAGTAAQRAKEVYQRTRPYLHNEGNICIERSDSLSKSFDYPSGHSSLGWVSGLVVAQLAPDRATQVLARARAFGESRVVCGVHNMSAIEAGRTNGAGVFAALQASPDFQSAMTTAKAEIAAARTSGKTPDAAACAKEAELTKPLAVP
ncbi:MAG TPA: phosphatase PAP2 family protein [Hyphomonadaceae bacterium]|nr:phosphatase PAP2 family protein [Hyphomonadaceae bacterium]